MKILLIINPKAGRHKISRKIKKLENNFIDNSEIELITKYTKKEFNAEAIVKNYNLEGIDLIIFCGGDGTLNEGVNGLIASGCNIPVSFIPLGTMNDFARTIKMPTNRLRLSKALKNKEEFILKETDIGFINNDRLFCYVAAFGNFTDVGYATSQKFKNIVGKLAYYCEVIKRIFKIKSYEVTVKTEGGVSFKDEILFGSISNTIYTGGLRFFKRSDINLCDDTLMMLLIRKPENISGYFKIIRGFLKKEYTIENNYYCKKIKKLELVFKDEVPWTIDGEYAGKMKEAKLDVIDKKIRFAIPKNSKEDAKNIRKIKKENKRKIDARIKERNKSKK